MLIASDATPTAIVNHVSTIASITTARSFCRRLYGVAPLPTEGRGCKHQDAADAAPEQQLGQDQPGFDGLAESDVVRDQQADARHAERLSAAARAGSRPGGRRRGTGLQAARGVAGRGRRRRGTERGRSTARHAGARRSPPAAWRPRRSSRVRAGSCTAPAPTAGAPRPASGCPCTPRAPDAGARCRRRTARRPPPRCSGCAPWPACGRGGRWLTRIRSTRSCRMKAECDASVH